MCVYLFICIYVCVRVCVYVASIAANIVARISLIVHKIHARRTIVTRYAVGHGREKKYKRTSKLKERFVRAAHWRPHYRAWKPSRLARARFAIDKNGLRVTRSCRTGVVAAEGKDNAPC